MKRKLKLTILLLIITLSIFNFANKKIVPIVNATYFEGKITQDTLWTLVDSPFIISKNVTIESGATLTIEPGVEVRFGGPFSLIVEGKLIAHGTANKTIKFTSNGFEPEPKDWKSIEFNGTEKSSLTYCTIEYGENGIVIENGTVEIKNSLIAFNFESGIKIMNGTREGTVKIEKNLIANNNESGIYIAGGKQIFIQNNKICSNKNGITLAGNLTLTPNITIQQNTFSSNGNSGIFFEAVNYSSISVTNNTFSENHYGLYIATNASTYLTHNYIFNNTVGIFYAEGNHTAYFNNIYNNTIGMEVSNNAVVNAEYNYWGDRTGPYHRLLNPYGRGNEVNGNGVNLDFIFFLTAPIDYNNKLPTAILWTDKTVVAPNQNVTFIGTYSSDEGRVDKYFFDFGDGQDTGWTTLSLFTHKYSSVGTYMATLKVMDDFGNESSNLAKLFINVQNLTPLDVSLTLSNYAVNYKGNISVTVYVSDGKNPIENANVTLLPVVKGGTFEPLYGVTNLTGYFTTTYTAPNVKELTNIRIIAKASKSGYADGSGYKYLKVFPPLKAWITANPETVESEEKSTITVNVTDSFKQPIANASVFISSNYGTLSATQGITDNHGVSTFLFTAPKTSSAINVTITATVTKIGYGGTQSQEIITVKPKTLTVNVTANPAKIITGKESVVTVHVTCNKNPVPDVNITVSSDKGGNFSATRGTTDLNGNFVFIFIGPWTMSTLNITITANATKDGYRAEEGKTIITVMPKILSVQAIVQPNPTVSEAIVNVTVNVTHNLTPVSEANVTVKLGNHEFLKTGVTNAVGTVSFNFTAPAVNEKTNITITVYASKTGYVDGKSELNLTVNPGILNVKITPSATIISSGETADIIIYVSCNSTPIANASVTVWSSHGNFSTLNGLTDSKGYCRFIFNAPETAAQLSVTVKADAAKNGFIGTEKQVMLTIIPETQISGGGGGFPIGMLLLIIVPVVIAVVIVVLVKLKIIMVYEEES